MTSPEQHLDVDAAAALDEGLEIDDVQRAHAEACPECSRRLGQIRATRALLSALPEETMPAAVAERMQAALPREPALTTVVPASPRRRRLSSSTLAGLLAAAAAIALVAAISVGALRSSGNGSGSGGSSAGAGVAAPRLLNKNFPVLVTGSRYTDANAATLVSQLDALVRPPSATGGGAATNSQTQSKDALSLAPRTEVPSALAGLFANRQQLLACVRLLAGAPIAPLAVDFARFTGGLRHVHNAPAMVILLAGDGAAPDNAFIVGPNCTTDPSQDLYKFQVVPGR